MAIIHKEGPEERKSANASERLFVSFLISLAQLLRNLGYCPAVLILLGQAPTSSSVSGCSAPIFMNFVRKDSLVITTHWKKHWRNFREEGRSVIQAMLPFTRGSTITALGSQNCTIRNMPLSFPKTFTLYFRSYVESFTFQNIPRLIEGYLIPQLPMILKDNTDFQNSRGKWFCSHFLLRCFLTFYACLLFWNAFCGCSIGKWRILVDVCWVERFTV